MFCRNCGAELSEDNSFCGICGMTIASLSQEERRNENGLIGFSPKINDPAFRAYKKKNIAWSLIFASILAVIAVVGFPVYRNMSGEIDWSGSLLYGFAIGGMFIVICVLARIIFNTDSARQACPISSRCSSSTGLGDATDEASKK